MLARMRHQRQAREQLDVLLQREGRGVEVVHQPGVGIQLGDDPVVVRGEQVVPPRVRHARGHREQVVDRDLALGGDQLDLAPIIELGDLHVRELGDELGDRVGQRDQSPVPQLHHRNRARDLRHRREPKDAVGAHRDALSCLPEGLEVADLAVPGHQDDDALVSVIVQVCLHQLVDMGEIVAGHADAFGFDDLGDRVAHVAAPLLRVGPRRPTTDRAFDDRAVPDLQLCQSARRAADDSGNKWAGPPPVLRQRPPPQGTATRMR